MVVEGVGPEAPTLPGEQIPQSRRLMVSTDISPQRVVADGGEAGQEALAVGVQLVGLEVRSIVEVEGAKARIGRGDYGW